MLYFEDRTISPLKNSHGDITAFVSVGRSLIRRNREEEQYQAFVEGSASAFVVVTGEGRIVLVNRETERMFGYARQELLGKPLEILLPERFREVHTKHRACYLLDLFPRPMGTGLDLYARRKDGSEFPVEISLGPIETDEGLLITSIVSDITARKQAEERIRASLKQKEVLLQEIHHRVKNNLQIISSLLSLQSARIRDKQAREMFTTSQSRVRSIALLHEKLYQSKDLSRIDFAEYSRSLAANLLGSYGIDSEDIALKVSVEDGFLGIDAAIPCGLIVNELVSNSLKHAFPAGKRGEIIIDLRQDKQNKYMFSVRDNGVGFPKDVDFRKTESLGLQLVCTLTDQLGGTIELRLAEGTEFRIGFDSGVP